MRTINLYGALGREFGKKHSFSTETVRESVDALRANFPEFLGFVRDKFFRVIVGKNRKSGMALDEAMLDGFKLGNQDLHIIPVVKGSKRGGLGKIIAGIALVGLSLATGGTATAALMGSQIWGTATVGSMVGSIGVSMALTGVATMIAPEQKAEDTKQSYTMTGPQVTTSEGGIVPIAYGEVITGGTMINGALSILSQDQETDNPNALQSFVSAFGSKAG